jgi:tuftelin-interacting protein 11
MSHFDLDDSDDSVIHQDSDDEQAEHDDDIDIGFRRHQYETVDNGRPKRARKEDALYGVFYEEQQRQPKRSKNIMDPAPMFVSATKTEAEAAKPKNENPFVAATKTDAHVPFNNDDKKEKEQEETKEETKEDSQEDREIRDKQKAADDYFLSLLNKGRGRQRPKLHRTETERTKPQGDEPFTGGLGMPSSFAGTDRLATQATRRTRSNMGKWEKHTKGIGGKLMAKMGWTGAGGLGSNRRKLKELEGHDSNDKKAESSSMDQEAANARKGISRPVEVVVRPANLGLGFGSFKEASQLKGNRQIEAEVRGIELPSEKKKRNDEEENDASWGPATASSAMSGTNELLAQKQWKRVRKAKAPKLKVIPYNELIDKQKNEDGQPPIIDMRGPAATEKETTTQDGQVALGAELLHNVSFLLNTHENKLHSSSHFLKATKQKYTSFKSDLDGMEKRKKEGDERIAKLKSTLSIVDQIEALTQQQQGNENSPKLFRDVQTLIQELGDEFTAEERQSLNFWEMLAPAMLSPVIQIQLDRWDVLDSLKSSQSVVDSVFGVGQTYGKDDSEASRSLRNSIIENQLLPKIKQALESSRWIPSRDMDVAQDLYEYVHQKAVDNAPKKKGKDPNNREDNGNVFVSDDEEEFKDTLPKTVKKVLILDTIHPKLQNALKHWKPSLKHSSKGAQIDRRLDLWILPWLQHLDHPHILPNLIADCRKKTKSSIEFLHRNISDDMEFLRTSIDVLKPWQRVFDSKAMQRLVSENVTPRLARYLAKQKILQNATQQQWQALEIVFEMHQGGLLSDIEFISVIEGEMLVKWAAMIHVFLINSGGDLSQAVQNYATWKLHTLTKKVPDTEYILPVCSLQLLQGDDYVCGIFYSVLRMIQLANKSQRVELDEMSVPVTNFRVVLARRMKEHQSASEEDSIRFQSRSAGETEARVRLQRRNIQTPTFREVVEEFARDRGISFQPRMGSNSLKDGRQTFYFGQTPIYVEGDVVFALKDKEWLPVPLDQLSAF